MTTSLSAPATGTGSVITPAVTLPTESRTKLAALGNAWVLAKMELAKPAPRELKWVQTVADNSSTDQLSPTLLTEYTNAPETKRKNEVAALEAFVAGALLLIKSIAAEAPADAQSLINGWVKKLEYYKNDYSQKATDLQKGVDELNEVIKEITPSSTTSASAT